MNENEVNDLYFEWMYQLVCTDQFSKISYRKLLNCLNNIPFTYTIAMDENREQDGIELRYRFGYEYSFNNSMIATYIDCKPCSVLEMMVALAMRCEENIMSDPELGNRLGQWFWNMIVNLGLGSMNDSRYNERFVTNTIEKFLNHNYDPDGYGGLFCLDNCNLDARNMEIWQQMNWYLNSLGDD